jgi:DNA-directed RNA polymerase subunit L
MATSSNIAPLITPEISATLTRTDQIIAFGDQLKKQDTQKVIIGAASNLLKNKLAALTDIIQKQKQAGVDKSITLAKIAKDFKNKKITKEQYENVLRSTIAAYQTSIAIFKDSKQQIQQSLKAGNEVVKRIEADSKRIKKENLKLELNTKKSEIRAKADLAKSVLKNPKTLLLIYPGVGLLITNAFLNFITQRKKLEEQVDVVNYYIDTRVIDEPSVIIATNLKNNTIKAINDAIAKLKAIEEIVKTINTALKIASVALSILTLFPIPVPMPILKIFDKLSQIIAGLSAVLSVCATILSDEIRKLKELIEKLKQIIIKLNRKTLSILTDDQLLKLIQTILPVGDVNAFQTLIATPVSGSTGFVNIGGRIVPLNSTSAAGSLSPSGVSTVSGVTNTGLVSNTGTTGGIGTGVGGTGTGTVGTGVGVTGTGTGIGTIGTGVGVTGTGTGIGTVGTGVEGTGIGTVGTGVGVTGTGIGTGTGTGGTGVNIGTGGVNTSGVGIGIGGTNVISPSNQTVTSSVGSTNGTGIGVTTTGGTGTGGVNVGPTGVISNSGILNPLGNLGANSSSIAGSTELYGGITSGLDIEDQPIIPIDLNQISISGIDEVTLDQLESFSLETLEDPQSLSPTPQVPSLSNQANLYRGFKFQVKEEQDPRFTVRGTIKRRYAVAVDRQGVEVLKSEYSFTLDPNDLVDQLKLVIDRQKLQG